MCQGWPWEEGVRIAEDKRAGPSLGASCGTSFVNSFGRSNGHHTDLALRTRLGSVFMLEVRPNDGLVQVRQLNLAAVDEGAEFGGP